MSLYTVAKQKLSDPKVRHIVLYLIFGGLTTVVNFGCYTAFTRLWHWEETFANVVAVFISVVFAFVVNKVFVFQSKVDGLGALCRETLRFFGARGLTIVLDIAGLFVFHNVLGINDLLVKIVLTVLIILLNYLISKFFVFKKATSF